jgi:hypothetical protein
LSDTQQKLAKTSFFSRVCADLNQFVLHAHLENGAVAAHHDVQIHQYTLVHRCISSLVLGCLLIVVTNDIRLAEVDL